MSLPFPRIITAILLGCSMCCAAQNTPPPSWVYSSYFGGSSGDSINAMTRDASGNIYVTGISSSPNLPTTAGVYEPSYPGPAGDSAIFLSKFSATGSLLWSTFLGPGTSQFLVASSIQVDSSQNVYVAGIFEGTGFPTTPGMPNSGSVFVTKLSPDASQLVYSTIFGGNSILANPQLVIDNATNAFVTGAGDSCCDGSTGIIGSLGGISDFWIAEISAAGIAFPWSVEMGGNGDDEAYGLAIDSTGKLYLTGYCDSSNFPVTSGALDQAGLGRTFVAKFNPAQPPASSLVYSALLGNPAHSSNDFMEGMSIALDQSNHAYVAAWTYNLGLYTSKWAFQPKALSTPNVYVFELNQAGSALLNGTYIEGSKDDYIRHLSVDALSNIYVSGFTFSWDFLTTAYGVQGTAFNTGQAYYVKLNPQFAAISSVEYGGNGYTEGSALVPDGSGGLWVGGYTGASQFATTANAYQPTYGGNYDAFLLHTNFAPLCGNDDEGVEVCSIAADPNLSERMHFTAQAASAGTTTDTSLQIDNMNVYDVHAAQFDTWLPVAPGNHVAKAISRDSNGKQNQDTQSFSVSRSSTCPLNPVNPSLTLCSPLNAAVIHGPLTIQAVANDSVPPPSVYLYVDGAFITTVTLQNGTYTYTLQLPPGIHQISMVGRDNQAFILYTAATARVAQ